MRLSYSKRPTYRINEYGVPHVPSTFGTLAGIAVGAGALAKIGVEKLPMTVAEFDQFFRDTNLELVKAANIPRQ
jgi:hypothetical protein